jgi:hypothetical protein
MNCWIVLPETAKHSLSVQRARQNKASRRSRARPALFAQIGFFVVGLALLWRVDPHRTIAEAGYTGPVVV